MLCVRNDDLLLPKHSWQRARPKRYEVRQASRCKFGERNAQRNCPSSPLKVCCDPDPTPRRSRLANHGVALKLEDALRKTALTTTTLIRILKVVASLKELCCKGPSPRTITTWQVCCLEASAIRPPQYVPHAAYDFPADLEMHASWPQHVPIATVPTTAWT